jgi:hypothetical protein
MKKYFVLYMAPVAEMQKMMAGSTPEQQKEGMDAWMQWMEAHKEHFVEMGSPLGKTMRVKDGAVESAANDVGGYSIVQANSHEEAAEIMKDSPHFMLPGAWIDVLEIMPM